MTMRTDRPTAHPAGRSATPRFRNKFSNSVAFVRYCPPVRSLKLTHRRYQSETFRSQTGSTLRLYVRKVIERSRVSGRHVSQGARDHSVPSDGKVTSEGAMEATLRTRQRIQAKYSSATRDPDSCCGVDNHGQGSRITPTVEPILRTPRAVKGRGRSRRPTECNPQTNARARRHVRRDCMRDQQQSPVSFATIRSGSKDVTRVTFPPLDMTGRFQDQPAFMRTSALLSGPVPENCQFNR